MAPGRPPTQGNLHVRFPGILGVKGGFSKILDRRMEHLDTLEHKTMLIVLRCRHLLPHTPVLRSFWLEPPEAAEQGGSKTEAWSDYCNFNQLSARRHVREEEFRTGRANLVHGAIPLDIGVFHLTSG